MRLGDVGERERLSDGKGEPPGGEQVGDQGERVRGTAGFPSAEADPVPLRSGEIGDRDDVGRRARELDQVG